jgi:hypothetical protein
MLSRWSAVVLVLIGVTGILVSAGIAQYWLLEETSQVQSNTTPTLQQSPRLEIRLDRARVFVTDEVQLSAIIEFLEPGVQVESIGWQSTLGSIITPVGQGTTSSVIYRAPSEPGYEEELTGFM